MQSKKNLLNKLKGPALISAGFALYYVETQTIGLRVKCVFHLITGLRCPGCGITSMFVELLHGNFWGAFFANPFVFCVSPLLGVILICNFFKVFKKTSNVLSYILLIGALAFGIIRNIPRFAPYM